MAQLKSTVITGDLSVTDEIVASKIKKSGGLEEELLRADGSARAIDSEEIKAALGDTPILTLAVNDT
jgi:hypothetical protein